MNTFGKSSLEIDINIIGQLIAADNMLHVFPSDKKICEFVTRALQIVPGVISCGMCIPGVSKSLDSLKEDRCHTCKLIHADSRQILCTKCSLMGQEGIHVFSLETPDRFFGFLTLKIDTTGKFTPYESFLRNFANSATINMENRWQKEKMAIANNELQQALKEIKTLRGILPLCSFCKKIRDDKGYWEEVDVYIHKHSQADISHGICPECAKEHYPDLDIYDD